MTSKVVNIININPFHLVDDLMEIIASFLDLQASYQLLLSCKDGVRIFRKYGIKNFRKRIDNYITYFIPDLNLNKFFDLKFPEGENEGETHHTMFAQIDLANYRMRFDKGLYPKNQKCDLKCGTDPLITVFTSRKYPYKWTADSNIHYSNEEEKWVKTISHADSEFDYVDNHLVFFGEFGLDSPRVNVYNQGKCSICNQEISPVSMTFRTNPDTCKTKIQDNCVEYLRLHKDGISLNIKRWFKYVGL